MSAAVQGPCSKCGHDEVRPSDGLCLDCGTTAEGRAMRLVKRTPDARRRHHELQILGALVSLLICDGESTAALSTGVTIKVKGDTVEVRADGVQ